MEQKIKRLNVSEATISAVNAILYSGQGGKDFSAIIDDLTAGFGRNHIFQPSQRLYLLINQTLNLYY